MPYWIRLSPCECEYREWYQRGSIFDPLLFDDVINKICFYARPKLIHRKPKCLQMKRKESRRNVNRIILITQLTKEEKITVKESNSTFSSILQSFKTSDPHLFALSIFLPPPRILHRFYVCYFCFVIEISRCVMDLVCKIVRWWCLIARKRKLLFSSPPFATPPLD